MALFGLFGGKSESSQLQKHIERVANKRLQSPDRWDSIQALVRARTSEAIAGLLPRFTFYVDPSISDQDEKDAAFEGIIAAGEMAIEPVVAFLRKAESLSWPLKMLDRLERPEAVIGHLLDLLVGMDTEYERDPQRKIQVLAALEERRDPRIGAAIVRFVEDANETVRFHAVSSLLAQPDAEAHREALLAAFEREESVRVRARILDGFAAARWSLGERAPSLRPHMPSGFALDRQGVPTKS